MENSLLPDLSLIKMHRYSTMTVQYSRGCPFNCEFCDIIEIYGRSPAPKLSPRCSPNWTTSAGWLARSRLHRRRQLHRQQEAGEGTLDGHGRMAAQTRSGVHGPSFSGHDSEAFNVRGLVRLAVLYPRHLAGTNWARDRIAAAQIRVRPRWVPELPSGQSRRGAESSEMLLPPGAVPRLTDCYTGDRWPRTPISDWWRDRYRLIASRCVMSNLAEPCFVQDVNPIEQSILEPGSPTGARCRICREHRICLCQTFGSG